MEGYKDGCLNKDFDEVNWEHQITKELEKLSENQRLKFNSETEVAESKLGLYFQRSAAYLTALYKGALDNKNSLWNPFQAAATSLTSLYKESLLQLRRICELSIQIGYLKRTKEIANWTKDKSYIEKGELLTFLSGKYSSSSNSNLKVFTSVPVSNAFSLDSSDQHFTTFREALGDHAHVSIKNFSSMVQNVDPSPNLQAFGSEEFPHQKRFAPSSPTFDDTVMPSPCKRRKFPAL